MSATAAPDNGSSPASDSAWSPPGISTVPPLLPSWPRATVERTLPNAGLFVVGVVRHGGKQRMGPGMEVVHVNAIVVKADPAELRARRERALTSVRLTEDALRARVEAGTATPDERDAWQEVDTVAFLLGPSAG